MPVFPHELGFADYFDERYDPLWNVIVEYDLPICCHIGLNTGLNGLAQRDPTPGKGVFVFNVGLSAGDRGRDVAAHKASSSETQDLKVVFVEPGLAWVAWVLWAIDDMAGASGVRVPRAQGTSRAPTTTGTSISRSSTSRSRSEKLRPELGVRNIMWSSDYPHPVKLVAELACPGRANVR